MHLHICAASPRMPFLLRGWQIRVRGGGAGLQLSILHQLSSMLLGFAFGVCEATAAFAVLHDCLELPLLIGVATELLRWTKTLL